MYEKNLNKSINFRVSTRDYDFLSDLAEKRNQNISDVVRDIVGEYRRSVIVLEKLKGTLSLANELEGEIIRNGD